MSKKEHIPTYEETGKINDTMTPEQDTASLIRERVRGLLEEMGHEGFLVYNPKDDSSMGMSSIEGEIDGIPIVFDLADRLVEINGKILPKEAGSSIFEKYLGVGGKLYKTLESELSHIERAEVDIRRMKKMHEWTKDVKLDEQINKLLE